MKNKNRDKLNPNRRGLTGGEFLLVFRTREFKFHLAVSEPTSPVFPPNFGVPNLYNISNNLRHSLTLQDMNKIIRSPNITID